jgi:uncharacterized protein (UPF0248 family)
VVNSNVLSYSIIGKKKNRGNKKAIKNDAEEDVKQIKGIYLLIKGKK